MEFSISSFVGTIINFLILLGVLSYFLFRPINNFIIKRNKDIEDDINVAKVDRQKAEEFKLKNDEAYRNAKKEGKVIVENYKDKAEKVSQEIISDAHKEAEIILERAKKEMERERIKAEDEIKTTTIDLALELSKKALESSIDEAKHRQLIEEFISKVGN